MKLRLAAFHAARIVALAWSVEACGVKGAEDPGAVLRTYARALDEGRAEDAYRLLSADVRRSISLEAFRRMLKDDATAVAELAHALERPTAPPVVTAVVTSASGEALTLVLEQGRWRIDATAVDLYAQDTPRHAILGFLRAVERKRYDIVLKYVPDAHRDGLDAAKLKAAWEGPEKDDMAQIVAAVRRELPTAPIEQTGDRASLSYGAGTLQLVRERGQWKIEDFD